MFQYLHGLLRTVQVEQRAAEVGPALHARGLQRSGGAKGPRGLVQLSARVHGLPRAHGLQPGAPRIGRSVLVGHQRFPGAPSRLQA